MQPRSSHRMLGWAVLHLVFLMAILGSFAYLAGHFDSAVMAIREWFR